jgi:hypothetical protein
MLRGTAEDLGILEAARHWWMDRLDAEEANGIDNNEEEVRDYNQLIELTNTFQTVPEEGALLPESGAGS